MAGPEEPLSELRAAATRYCAWFEDEAPAAAVAVHAAVVDVLTVYRACALLAPTGQGESRVVVSHRETGRRLTERLKAAIVSANAAMPEVLPTATVDLPGLTRLYDELCSVRDVPPESLPALRAGWSAGWGGAALVDAGRLHDAFLLPVVTPRPVESVRYEDVDALRRAATLYCSWCESDTPLTPANVRAVVDVVLDLYQRCARIPADSRVSTDEVHVEMPNREFPDMGERLHARLGFYPGGLDDLYDYAWAIKHAAAVGEGFLFSLHNGWSDGWGGPALVDAGRLHDEFPPPPDTSGKE